MKRVVIMGTNRGLGKDLCDFYSDLGSFFLETIQNAHQLLNSSQMQGKLMIEIGQDDTSLELNQ